MPEIQIASAVYWRVCPKGVLTLVMLDEDGAPAAMAQLMLQEALTLSDDLVSAYGNYPRDPIGKVMGNG